MIFNLNHEAGYDAGLICGGTLEIFVEPILPQPRLYIFGGGHVSLALARTAHLAGFAIGVVDDRENVCKRQPISDGHDIFTSYENAFERLHPCAATYIVIVYARAQRRYARAGMGDCHLARYIGMIGSRRKVIEIYKALEKPGSAWRKTGARACAGGAGDWRADAGGNRRVHNGELIAVRRNATENADLRHMKLERNAKSSGSFCPQHPSTRIRFCGFNSRKEVNGNARRDCPGRRRIAPDGPA